MTHSEFSEEQDEFIVKCFESIIENKMQQIVKLYSDKYKDFKQANINKSLKSSYNALQYRYNILIKSKFKRVASNYDINPQATKTKRESINEHSLSVNEEDKEIVYLFNNIKENIMSTIPKLFGEKYPSFSEKFSGNELAGYKHLKYRFNNLNYAKSNNMEKTEAEDCFYKWPDEVGFDTNLDGLRQFYLNTDTQFKQRIICTVCGMFEIVAKIDLVYYSIDHINQYREFLSSEQLVENIETKHFEYNNNFSKLNGMVLDMNGFNFKTDEVSICTDCIKNLNSKKLPKFALANNLYTGVLPEELKDLTCVEESLIARHRVKCCIYKIHTKMNGSGQFKMSGNIITFVQNPDNILTILPSLPNNQSIKIVLIGNRKPIKSDLKKIFTVRRDKVSKALYWLKKHNIWYKDVEISLENIKLIEEDDIPENILEDICYIEDDNDEVTNNKNYDNIDRMYHDLNDGTEDFIDDAKLNISGVTEHSNSLILPVIDQIQKIAKSENVLSVPHGATPVGEWNNPLHLIFSFPLLFVLGIGGVMDDRRKIKLTYREHIIYLLKQSCNRFRRHRSFSFVTFNVLQRGDAQNMIRLLIKRKDFPQFAEQLKHVKLEDYTLAAENCKNGLKIDPKSPIGKLLNLTLSSTSCVQGSKASLKYRRNDIRAYIGYFGIPHFFITINPADIHSPIMLFLDGETVTLDILSKTAFKYRADFLKKNSFLQAIYFDIVVNNFIKFLLGYDPSGLNKIGILGKVKSYYGIVEGQSRGSLHIHFLIWVENAVDPNEFKLLLKNAEFTQKLVKYLDEIIKCDTSELIFGDNDEADIHPCCDSPNYLRETDPINIKEQFLKDVLTLVKVSSVHKCNSGCYKYDDKICRMGYGVDNEGKPLCNETSVNTESGKITQQRLDRHINNYNPFLMAALRCNHDIKYLGSSSTESLSIIYYLTNYITKAGLSTADAASLAIMAYKKFDKYTVDKTDDNQNAKKLIFGLYNAVANRTEYSGAQVANMILNNGKDGTHYSSHKTKTLALFNLIKLLKNEDDETDENVLVPIPEISDDLFDSDFNPIQHDYEYRDGQLSEICLYEYFLKFSKCTIYVSKGKDGETRGRKPLKRYKFKTTHMQHKTHEMIKNKDISIPVLIGPTVPRKSDVENRELYSKIIIILFKPWTNISELKSIDNWEDVCKVFIKELEDNNKYNILKYINNLEYLKKSEDDANDDRKNNVRQFEDSSELSEEEDDVDQVEIFNVLEDLINKKTDTSNEKWMSEAVNILNLQKEKNDDEFQESKKSGNISSDWIINYDDFQQKNIKDWTKQFKLACVPHSDEMSGIEHEDLIENLVCISDDIDLRIPYNEENFVIENEITNASILDIINTFELNELQEKAFRLFCENCLEENDCIQRLIYLGGDAGTGKSQVIKAIKEYFTKNNRLDSILFSASTGSAANGIRGHTIHKLVGFTTYQKGNECNLIQLRQRWKNVKFLIIDEISMIGLITLQFIHQQICEAKDIKQNFGGLTILFCGDFNQFPPVRQHALYHRFDCEKSNTYDNSKITTPIIRNHNGRLLWLGLTHSVILTEQMRQKDDVQYAELLVRAKNRCCTDQDFKLLNTRIINKQTNLQAIDNLHIILTRNNLRSLLNKLKAKEFAMKWSKIQYNCVSSNSFKNNCSKFELSIIDAKMKLQCETKCNNLSYSFPMIENCKYFITNNTLTELGLVNGAIVTLKKLCIDKNKITSVINSNEFNMNQIPKYIIVEMEEKNDLIHFNGLPVGHVPLFPMQLSFQLNLDEIRAGRKLSVRRTQYSLTPYFCVTAYRVQGRTLIAGCIVDLCLPPTGTVDSSYTYVSLSRVKRLSDLHILRPFDKKILNQEQPINLKMELERLKALSIEH